MNNNKHSDSIGQFCNCYSLGYFSALNNLILSAEHEIIISTFALNFIPGLPSNYITMLFDSIVSRMGEKKIRCRIALNDYVPGSRTLSGFLKLIKYLNKKKIEVRFNLAPQIQHAKFFLIDQKYLCIGSHNLTHTAMINPYELSCVISDSVLVEKMINKFDSHWQDLSLMPVQEGMTWH